MLVFPSKGSTKDVCMWPEPSQADMAPEAYIQAKKEWDALSDGFRQAKVRVRILGRHDVRLEREKALRMRAESMDALKKGEMVSSEVEKRQVEEAKEFVRKAVVALPGVMIGTVDMGATMDPVMMADLIEDADILSRVYLHALRTQEVSAEDRTFPVGSSVG